MSRVFSMRWTWLATNILSEKWYKSNISISDYIARRRHSSARDIWYANGLQLMRDWVSEYRALSFFALVTKNRTEFQFENLLTGILRSLEQNISDANCYREWNVLEQTVRAKCLRSKTIFALWHELLWKLASAFGGVFLLYPQRIAAAPTKNRTDFQFENLLSTILKHVTFYVMRHSIPFAKRKRQRF